MDADRMTTGAHKKLTPKTVEPFPIMKDDDHVLIINKKSMNSAVFV